MKMGTYIPWNVQLYELVHANKVIISFTAGIVISFFFRSFSRAIINALAGDSARNRRGLYSLDHAKLNLSLPLASMWMNMGYWKRRRRILPSGREAEPEPDEALDSPLDMSFACPNLLAKVLEVAGLLRRGGNESTLNPLPSLDPSERRPPAIPPISVLDVGFGCGDQTRALLELSRGERGHAAPAERAFPFLHSTIHPYRYQACRVAAYVGLTQDARQLAQANVAVQRWRRFARRYAEQMRANDAKMGRNDTRRLDDTVADTFHLFCADGSRPERWSDEIKHAVAQLPRAPAEDRFEEGEKEDDEEKAEALERQQTAQTWLLGLDSLYHMQPSRQPLLSYAHRELGASFMAFDLLLAPSSSLSSGPRMTMWQRLLLRLVCLLTATPRRNLMSADEYMAMLVRAGYRAQDIVIEDISEHVFAPLAAFLERQGRELTILGLGLGAFNVARWIFGWWAETGIVRGCVVVARHERHVVERAA